MNKELYINDKLIDLNEGDSPVALNFAVNNLAELKDRQAYSSNIFKIPNSEKNRKDLGYPDNENLINAVPYRKNKARFVQNGVELFSDGVAILQGAGEKISVQVLAGIAGFFESIEGKYLSDLNLDEYNHTFNSSAVSLQSKTDGWLYPIIDYGELSVTNRRVNVDQLRPAMFLHSIIKKIIEQSGFTYAGSIFSNAEYLRELLPFSNDKFIHSKAYQNTTGTHNVNANKNFQQVFSQTESTVTSGILPIITFDDFSDPGNRWDGSKYTAGSPVKVVVNVKMSVSISMLKMGPTPSASHRLQRSIISGGTVYWENVATFDMGYPGNSSAQIYDVNLGAELTLKPGEGFRVVAVAIMEGSGTPSVIGTTIQTSSVMTVTENRVDIILGQTVQASAIVPNITQKDLIKDFMQRKGLTVIPATGTRHVTFVNMDLVYTNRPIAKNWTKKILSGKEYSYSMPGYAINNNGKFKEDSAVPTAIGAGVMVLDNQTVTPSLDIFTSVFAGTEIMYRLSGLQVASIKKIEDPAKSRDFTIKTEPRILVNALLSNSGIIIDDGEFPSSIGVRSVPYFSRAGQYSLDYQYVFDNYYISVKKMINRPLIISVPALLSEIDVCNINWSVPIYDEKTSEYYYINEINDYIQGRPCKLTLIRL